MQPIENIPSNTWTIIKTYIRSIRFNGDPNDGSNDYTCKTFFILKYPASVAKDPPTKSKWKPKYWNKKRKIRNSRKSEDSNWKEQKGHHHRLRQERYEYRYETMARMTDDINNCFPVHSSASGKQQNNPNSTKKNEQVGVILNH